MKAYPNSTKDERTLDVEKPQFSIVFNSSCALLKSKITWLHVSFTTYEYFYKLSKSALFSRWLLQSCDPEEPVIHDHIYILVHLCLQT